MDDEYEDYGSIVGGLPEDSDDSDEEEEDEEEEEFKPEDYPSSDEKKIDRGEHLRMMHLRSHIDKLSEEVQNKQYSTQKTREELKKCQGRCDELESERDKVDRDMDAAESEQNVASYFRLKAKHERICNEIQGEIMLAREISGTLEDAECELNKAQVDLGSFLKPEQDLRGKEQRVEMEKNKQTINRIHNENRAAVQADGARRAQQRENINTLKEKNQQWEKAMEDARLSQEQTKQYLKSTLTKIKDKEAEEATVQQDQMKTKMVMLLKLKEDITGSRENMRALQARDEARAKSEAEEEAEQRRQIIEQGGNPDEVMLVKQRLDMFEKQKTDFDSAQKTRQAEIMEKLLLEQNRLKQRKKQQPQLWRETRSDVKASTVTGPKKKKLKKLDRAVTMPELDMELDMNRAPLGGLDTEQTHLTSSEYVDRDDSDSDDEEEEDEEEEFGANNLAQPEFEGMWDQHKAYKVPKDIEASATLPEGSKMDKEILAARLEMQKSGIVTKQVVAGKEFKGCAFNSKPDVIHFKDFDVGQTYKKKITLTNVSYTITYCKHIGITERLKDFITVTFEPPGQMSAGMTCELTVVFKPMINEDLDGVVHFLAQTGPFSIPLRCTTKKCDLSVDTSCVDFGTTVIGETLKKTFVLSNKGASGTTFEFYKVTGLKNRTVTTAETSLGRMTSDSAGIVSPVSKQTGEQSEEVEGGGHSSDSGLDAGKDEDNDASSVKLQATIIDDGTSNMGVSDLDDAEPVDGMSVGKKPSGSIGPFASVKIEIVWQPLIPGNQNAEFVLSFGDEFSENISVESCGIAVAVPVWVERENIDLKICMFDRLYQDTIIVNNRATTALKLRFEVCKELKNHLELLPKTGYIQAQSQFSAQLKFLPRKSLFEDAENFFDKETGVLEAPLVIKVANQTKPVPFTVQAVLTNSEMAFNVTKIDFGCCTIHESVKTRVQLTNDSILSQQYGFMGLPEHIDVQPNDGFGTLLPLETIDLDVIFSPQKAQDYNFVLTCKSLINRDFTIQCKGTGVLPPLELSHQVVHFAATPLYDVSTTSIQVINSHTSTNEYTHPVPRVGKGEIAPVGPTSFEFVLPENSPITISPAVGTIEPGQKCRVHLRFSPHLEDATIRKEGVRMATKMLEAKANKEYKEALARQKEREQQEQAGTTDDDKKKGGSGPKPSMTTAGSKVGKGAAGSGGGGLIPNDVTPTAPAPVEAPQADTIKKNTPAYTAAVGSLLRHFKGQFNTYVIPCYVASGQCTNPGELQYSIHNTLYLEVHCPLVKPPVVVISDHGCTNTDFGNVSVGQHVTKSVTIQNISDKTIEVRSSILNTSGPFVMLNALRILPPAASHTVIISFTPTQARVFHEVFEIRSVTATLYITLTGSGVDPLVNVSVDTCLDMGAVLVGEFCERTFKIENVSSLAVDYIIKQDSGSFLRATKAHKLPSFLDLDDKKQSYVGTQNNSGQNVFDCVPSRGTVAPDACEEITVTFAPDHASDFYSDGARIALFGQEECHFFQMQGQAKPHVMFIDGVDKLSPDVESLSIPSLEVSSEEESKAEPIPLVLTLHSHTAESELIPASRDVHVGCVRTMAVSQKKSGEFSFDNVQAITAKGFTVEPQKGLVEAGTKKSVTITWTPPQGHNPAECVEGSIIVTLRGDTVDQYRLILRAIILSQ